MIRTTVIATLALTLAATPASADRFVMLSVNPTSTGMTAIDLDTIKPVGALRRAWVMTGFSNGGEGGKPTYLQSLYEFDCQQERMQVLTTIQYDPVTNNAGRNLPPDPWSYPAPQTVGQLTLAYGCGKIAKESEIHHMNAAQFFQAFMAFVANRAK